MQESVPCWTRDRSQKVPQAEEQFINSMHKETLNPGHNVFHDEM